MNETVAPYTTGLAEVADLRGHVADGIAAFVRWAIEHPAYAQLMFWRPVPGYEPSSHAYAPAIEAMHAVTTLVRALLDRGVLRPDAVVDDAAATLTVLVSGVISQQLANAPGETFEQGRFTRLLPHIAAMFLAGYGDSARHEDSAGHEEKELR